MADTTSSSPLSKWYNHPSGAYKSIEGLYKKVKGEHTKKQVSEFIRNQVSNQTRSIESTGSFTPTYVGQQFHADIGVFGRVNYLVAVDALSGFMHVFRLGAKTSANLIAAFEKIEKLPDSIFFDGEAGIGSEAFRLWAESKNISVIQSRTHAPRAERAILTIKTRLSKAQADSGGSAASLIPGIVEAYNTEHEHERHGLTPEDAQKKKNLAVVVEKTKKAAGRRKSYPPLEKGDRVRIRVSAGTTGKASTAVRFSEGLHTVTDIKETPVGLLYFANGRWFLRKDLKIGTEVEPTPRPARQRKEPAPSQPRQPSTRKTAKPARFQD